MFIESLIIAFALSLDAFALATVVGATPFGRSWDAIARISFNFGLFQALMPIAGYFLGKNLVKWIEQWDHWIAASIIFLIAFKMILDHHSDDTYRKNIDPSKGIKLVGLSIACSLDAFAVGFSFSLIHREIWMAALLFGIITSIVSCIGLRLGALTHSLIGHKVEILGAIVLIGIGIKILIEHL